MGVGSVLRGAATVVLLMLTFCALFPSDRLIVAESPAAVTATAPPNRLDHTVSLPDSLAAEFTHLQSRLAGQVGMAIMPVGGGRMTIFGDWTSGIAWSTIKVPLAIAALRHDARHAIARQAEAAITVSDNAAAVALWRSLGDRRTAAAAVQNILDEAGYEIGHAQVRATLDHTAFGVTEWTLAGQTRFAAQLPCLPATEQVTDLMQDIAPDQAWGLGVLEGTAFKGGWGPDDTTGSYTARQFGVIPVRSGAIAVALGAQADSGTFDDATALLSQLAHLLGRHIDQLRGGSCPPIPSDDRVRLGMTTPVS